MKATLVRDCDVDNPEFEPTVAEACREAGQPYAIPKTILAKAGTVIDNPDAWWLVRVGAARPEDDACRTACGMTDAQIERAIKGVDKMAADAGIKIPPATEKPKK